MLIFLAEHRSFGVAYLTGLPLEQYGSAEDSVIRVPFWKMQKFGRFLSGSNHSREVES